MNSSPDPASPPLSIRKQPVVLVPPDPRWVEEFARESARVKAALSQGVIALHHIGSTAIPGIHAKPIIDMLLETGDLATLDQESSRLEALGYEVMGEFGLPGRRYFRKDDPAGRRTHQLHAFQAGSPQLARHVAFRDYLRAHREEALAYEALKLRLAAAHPEDISRYTDGKDDFIRRIDALALVAARSSFRESR